MSTLVEAFARTARDHPDLVALRTRGDATSITWGEYAERVRILAAKLARLGVARGRTFGLMLTNRPEFHLIDAAAMHLGATCFSIYNTSSPEQVAYLLEDAGRPIVVTEPALAPAVHAAGNAEHTLLLDELEALPARPGFDLEAAAGAITPDDVLCLIYTSGTTGPPKGVQLTHANLVAESEALQAVLARGPGWSSISFLPHAHIADRGLNHYLSMVVPGTLTCCPDPREVLAHVVDARPTVFGAVPRVWEKLKAALEAGFAADGTGRAALEENLARVRADEPPDRAAFAPLRERLGLDRVEQCVTGAAPMALEAFYFFAALGLPILEVWGMSETSAVATITDPARPRFGTVGKPLPGVEVELAPDGEVRVRGPIVMPGYRNQPERTAETFSEDGWLLTGDVGAWDDEGNLRIVDRKKELIINAAGKNMSPANIENQLKGASPLVGQAYVHGDARPYNVALVVLDPDVRGAFGGDPEAEIASAVSRANAKLSRVEQVKRWAVLDDEWLPGGEELTPTMKLRRKPIAQKYAAELEALYP